MIDLGTLDEYWEATARRKAELGLTTPVEELRNSGLDRTDKKRRLLAAAEKRAREAGVAPVKANF
ncbi:MAG: hypothetical protein ACSLE1_15870 [Sphingobium sp.]